MKTCLWFSNLDLALLATTLAHCPVIQFRAFTTNLIGIKPVTATYADSFHNYSSSNYFIPYLNYSKEFVKLEVFLDLY